MGAQKVRSVAVVPVLPAHRQVADQLQQLIVKGDLPAGMRLPSEVELAAEFGVSRNTLRAALKLLAGRNLTRTSRGVNGGTFVVGPGLADLEGRLADLVLSMESAGPVGRGQLLEARGIFEIETVRLAAERRTQGHIDLLERVIAEEVPADRQGRFDRHRAFHLAVTAAAQNMMLSSVIRPLFDALQMEFIEETANPGDWERIEAEHRVMFDAIKASDVQSAIDIAAVHVRSVEKAYFVQGAER